VTAEAQACALNALVVEAVRLGYAEVEAGEAFEHYLVQRGVRVLGVDADERAAERNRLARALADALDERDTALSDLDDAREAAARASMDLGVLQTNVGCLADEWQARASMPTAVRDQIIANAALTGAGMRLRGVLDEATS